MFQVFHSWQCEELILVAAHQLSLYQTRLYIVFISTHPVQEKICSSLHEKNLTASQLAAITPVTSSIRLELHLILFTRTILSRSRGRCCLPIQCFMAHAPNSDGCDDCTVTDAAWDLSSPVPESSWDSLPCCYGYSHIHPCLLPWFRRITAKNAIADGER